jgi:nucleoside phosphorylase
LCGQRSKTVKRMRILVTFAVDFEFKPWYRLGRFHPVPGSGRAFRGQKAGSDVRVILTGVGAVNAARSIRNSVEEIPDVCIASGLAGGLKHQHRSGEILVARAARGENAGTTYESAEPLFNAAVECGAKPVDQFISTGRVVRTAREKVRLGTSADAVDMESFAVMKEMSGLGVPCAAVRCVADPAEMDVPCDFDSALDGSGHIRIVQVLGQVASDPRRVWPLAQLGLRSTRAATSLARYLEGFTDYLAGSKEKMDLSVQHISQ